MAANSLLLLLWGIEGKFTFFWTETELINLLGKWNVAEVMCDFQRQKAFQLLPRLPIMHAVGETKTHRRSLAVLKLPYWRWHMQVYNVSKSPSLWAPSDQICELSQIGPTTMRNRIITQLTSILILDELYNKTIVVLSQLILV